MLHFLLKMGCDY
jgi:hypothetical protein